MNNEGILSINKHGWGIAMIDAPEFILTILIDKAKRFHHYLMVIIHSLFPFKLDDGETVSVAQLFAAF